MKVLLDLDLSMLCIMDYRRHFQGYRPFHYKKNKRGPCKRKLDGPLHTPKFDTLRRRELERKKEIFREIEIQNELEELQRKLHLQENLAVISEIRKERFQSKVRKSEIQLLLEEEKLKMALTEEENELEKYFKVLKKRSKTEIYEHKVKHGLHINPTIEEANKKDHFRSRAHKLSEVLRSYARKGYMDFPRDFIILQKYGFTDEELNDQFERYKGIYRKSLP